MHLHWLDWLVIASFLVISLIIGLRFKKRAEASLSDFFLSGRKLPWYIAGISMVATTFAADTPLWVTERVAMNGVSGNWLWWNMLIGGMLTTFFFARLWRRAGILTELELVELRYGGKTAAFLRGFKSVYMGIFLNAVIIGWVNLALMTILEVFFELSREQSMYYVIAIMAVVALYSSISGLTGVAVTDAVQFLIAMAGCIILAVIIVQSPEIGGIDGLKEKLPAWRFEFFPRIQGSSDAVGVFSVSIGAFLTYSLVQWWASWYPGAEPGGGGYIAQRMMSTPKEKDAVYATLLFQIAHYALRPWPWIVVGLATLVIYPNLPEGQHGHGFVFAMRDFLPVGLKGLLLVAFLAAYMSTISTQLNWGASYLTNDLYKRFIKPPDSLKKGQNADKHYVSAARFFTVFIMLASVLAMSMMDTIDQAAQFMIQCGAGLGMVLILRWYWWRINAWSEITATIAPFLFYTVSVFGMGLQFPDSFLITVGGSTLSWLVVTMLTKPEKDAVLANFYGRVRPEGGWKPVRVKLGLVPRSFRPGKLILAWLSAVLLTYSVLFLIGKLVFHEWNAALLWTGIGIFSLILLRLNFSGGNMFED
jgi:solute:Na+ symporter, SSS family